MRRFVRLLSSLTVTTLLFMIPFAHSQEADKPAVTASSSKPASAKKDAAKDQKKDE